MYNIPNNYDSYLKNIYNDYQSFPKLIPNIEKFKKYDR